MEQSQGYRIRNLKPVTLAFAAVLALTSLTSAALPPFVSDTFDLYQLGSYQNPLTYRHSGTVIGSTRSEIFTTGHSAYELSFNFDAETDEWISGDIIAAALRWYNEDGTYVEIASVGPIMDSSVVWPYEYPLAIEGPDPDGYTRTYQIEWLDPSGELIFSHFIQGFYHGFFIDTVLCVFVAGFRLISIEVFRF